MYFIQMLRWVKMDVVSYQIVENVMIVLAH